jgi:sigma-B regulation protein RsbU (phosphoserine phosphatase)
VLALSGVGQRDRLVAESRRYDRARGETTRLLADYIDQETGQRGYVITADEDFLRPYERGRVQAAATEAELRQLLAPEPELIARLDRIRRAGRQWRRHAAEPEITAARQERPRRAAALVASDRGRRLFERIRAELASLRKELQRAQADTNATLDAARRRLNNVLYITFTAGALLLAMTARFLERWIARPLDRISAAVRGVSEGRLDLGIPVVGPPDVARLGADAELMRRRIFSELDAARRAEQALRQRGPTVAALRSHLSPSYSQLLHGLEVAAAFEPATGVLAGDWYDIVPLPGGAAALCLMDVSGHGPDSGIFALQAKSLLLAALRLPSSGAAAGQDHSLEPGAALGWLSSALGDTGDQFLTVVLAYLHPDGRCSYANAGHLPMLVSDGTATRELGPTGPLLGPLPGEWQTAAARLQPGDVLVAYTDGLAEARDPARHEFGTERLADLIAAQAANGAQAVVDACMDAVRSFAGEAVNDDLTLVAVSRLDADSPAP